MEFQFWKMVKNCKSLEIFNKNFCCVLAKIFSTQKTRKSCDYTYMKNRNPGFLQVKKIKKFSSTDVLQIKIYWLIYNSPLQGVVIKMLWLSRKVWSTLLNLSYKFASCRRYELAGIIKLLVEWDGLWLCFGPKPLLQCFDRALLKVPTCCSSSRTSLKLPMNRSAYFLKSIFLM